MIRETLADLPIPESYRWVPPPVPGAPILSERVRVTRFRFAADADFAHKARSINDLRYRYNQMPECSRGFVHRPNVS
jgi:hypothetical protein